jgi:hypothetical protein
MTPITHEYIAEIMATERLVDPATWRRIVEFLIDAYAADVGNARRECDRLRADYSAAAAVTGNMMREYAEMRDKLNKLDLKTMRNADTDWDE